MTDDSSALHRYRAKAQKPEDLAALEMLRVHLRSIQQQEARLNQLVEGADSMINTTFTTQSFENFSRKRDVTALRENYKNLLNHEARKERDARLAAEYTDGLRERNREAANKLQDRRNEREYWRQMLKALRETDVSRQQTHAELDKTRRELKEQIKATRLELERRIGVKAAVKAMIAELQLLVLEKESARKQGWR